MMRSDPFHRPGEGTSLREGWCRAPPESLCSLSPLSGGKLERAPSVDKSRSIDPHAMQDDAQLARKCHLGLGHACALGQFHPPAFQRGRALERFGQNRVGGLIERRADRDIADLADPPAVIRLTGLISLRRQAEM